MVQLYATLPPKRLNLRTGVLNIISWNAMGCSKFIT
jgi:hypothetical protein